MTIWFHQRSSSCWQRLSNWEPPVDDKMPAVGHQAPSQSFGTSALDGLFENAFESFVIAIFLEDGHTDVAAVQNIGNQAIISRMFGSTYAATITILSPNITKRYLTPFLRSPATAR
ncbi:MAG: hypothetical protein ACKO38_09670 [Planctomycetota bacterium]